MNNKNLYDTLEEADRRLHDTLVAYDGEPCRVLGITNHKKDGIFRIYLWPINQPYNGPLFPADFQGYNRMSPALGAYFDKWLEDHKDTPLMRKQASSPKFNKFRPFPLGMMNQGGSVNYLERSPERRIQQGLIRPMVDFIDVSLDSMRTMRNWPGNLSGQEFYDCVKANHPSAEECLENLLDPNCRNSAAAFNRNFAFVRGPLDTFFLAYKTDVVGFVPASKRPQVELGKKFRHLKETVEETRQFVDIRIR